MNRVSAICALLIMLATACAPQPAHSDIELPDATKNLATPATLSDEALRAELEAYMEQQAANLSFSGAALVARRGNILLQKGYGAANRRWKRPNTEHTQFRIASISKQFTAAAILLLQAHGKLEVRDHVCDYVSECPAAWADITLHQLLTHTSGIRNLYDDPGYIAWQATPAAPSEVMTHFIDLPLDFAPGTAWNYTDSGYDLLGLVIERASGLAYEEFLQENMFGPLGMRHSGLSGATYQATGYANSFELTPADTSHPTVDYASGGLYSTVGDLYIWDQALFKDEILLAGVGEKSCSGYEPMPEGGGLSYGYGCMVGDMYGHRMMGHTGRLEGFSTLNFYFPDDQVTVILLGNQRNPAVNGVAVEIARRVFRAVP